VAGLVAAGAYPNPVQIADVTTTTTHKTLRGPRGGIILAKSNPEIEKKLNSLVFPGTQGGPLMHVIAAKAVAFKEALLPEFTTYQQQVVVNARAMAKVFIERGYDVVSGGTDNHLFLVSFIRQGLTGKDVDAWLGSAYITVNKNSVPNDPQSPFVTSGIRIGTPAITTRGFNEAEAVDLAGWICDIIDARGDAAAIEQVKADTRGTIQGTRGRLCLTLCPFPLYLVSDSMRCPFCSAPDTKVIDSRLANDGDSVRRRRECLTCAERFTTYETAELLLPRMIKRDGSREPFAEDKLRSGFLRALEKRPVSTEAIEAAINRILHRMRATGERELATGLVGEWVMEELRELDEVAYVRFASVYRRFQDVNAFREEIERLQSEPSPQVRKNQLPLLGGDEK